MLFNRRKLKALYRSHSWELTITFLAISILFVVVLNKLACATIERADEALLYSQINK